MWRKLLAANVTEAISAKDAAPAAPAAPPSVKDVEAFLAAAQTAPESERQLNAERPACHPRRRQFALRRDPPCRWQLGASELSCEVTSACQSRTLPRRRPASAGVGGPMPPKRQAR